MNEFISKVKGKSRRRLLTALLITTVPFVPLAIYAQSSASSSATDDRSGDLLPRKFVVTLSLVSQFFPQIVQHAGTGRDSLAVGNPEATRAVFFSNSDSLRLVTVTVARYRTPRDAAVAYQEALEKSKEASGFRLIPLVVNVGQEAFAGTSSLGNETHIGLGLLDGRLIVGATLARFSATLDNFVNLVALARAEDAAANAADAP